MLIQLTIATVKISIISFLQNEVNTMNKKMTVQCFGIYLTKKGRDHLELYPFLIIILLFYRNRLGQISRLINITASHNRNVV